MLALYGLKNCSTCKKAMSWLDNNAVDYQFVDYREQPLDRQQLAEHAATLGWTKLVNRASMTWRKLPDQAKDPATDDAWLELVQANPTLIRRPLAVLGKEVRAGFKPAEYESWLL